ncbi:MAG: KEOPS complex kinase/ATPase Bud32 [Promethearchaeota archaeon]
MNSAIYKEKLIHKGAEASLWLGSWFDKRVIFKYRIPKEYRLGEIDRKIRHERTLNEGRALIKVKSYGINVPTVYEVDTQNSTIIMKFIEGQKLKNVLGTISNTKKEKYFKFIGQMVALLHINGHIHGDVTTSNLIITKNEKIFLIDFGLHEYSDTIEDKSVDLHLFKRVLASSHGDHYEICFNAFLEGYRLEYERVNSSIHKSIIENIDAIETRGRYVKSEERK